MNPIKVYLAAWFIRKDEMCAKRDELSALGIEVTSRWLDGEPAGTITLPEAQKQLGDLVLMDIAETDISDIVRADITILFTEDPLVGTPRGGRHFESGFAYCLTLGVGGSEYELITVGPRENVFHYMPEIKNFPTWGEAKLYLLVQYLDTPAVK